jgi:hypothetical protein
MPNIPAALRWTASRIALLVVGLALIGRARASLAKRRRARGVSREASRAVLPSLHDRHPAAAAAPRRRLGLRVVPVDRIVGTLRNPSQNTADFLPLPKLRGTNWVGRWQRLTQATERLATLPPIDLVKVGDEYYVADGHNRVAVARQAGMVEIDADVTEIVLPGNHVEPSSRGGGAAVDVEILRQASGFPLGQRRSRRELAGEGQARPPEGPDSARGEADA